VPNGYPGIDMVCYGSANRLEFMYLVAPGADPTRLHMAVDGAQDVTTDASGNLVLDMDCARIVQHAPRIYRIVDDVPVPVPAVFTMNSPTVRISTPDQPAGKIPDDPGTTEAPVLESLSYLGGAAMDEATAVAADAQGYTFLAGQTASGRFTTEAEGPQKQPNDHDAFVTRFRHMDGQPAFTAFLGGTAEDRAMAVLPQPDGGALVVGETLSRDFPVLNAPATQPAGDSWDLFLARVDPQGRLAGLSTRLGGQGDDHPFGVAQRPDGLLVIAGATTSDPAGAQPVLDRRDAFVALVDPTNGQQLAWRRIGGSGNDSAYGIALLPDGSVFIAGETESSDFPAQDALFAEPLGGADAFICLLSPDLKDIVFSSYLGGENDDRANGAAADCAGNLYVAGETASVDLPVSNAVQSVFAGGLWDAFAAKITPERRVVYLTYLGGDGDDRAFAVAPDRIGHAHLAGETSSTNLAVHLPVQAAHGGGRWDGFAARLDAVGGRLHYLTYLGGSQDDRLLDGAIGQGRYFHVAGVTASSDLRTEAPIQSRFGDGRSDALVARLAPPYPPGPPMALVPGGDQPGGPEYDYYYGLYETSNDEFVRFLNARRATPTTRWERISSSTLKVTCGSTRRCSRSATRSSRCETAASPMTRPCP